MDICCFSFGNGYDFVIKDNCNKNNFSHSETPHSYNITEEFESSGGERNSEVYSVQLLDN